MSGPTKAGEPSMEEILASIRKIIADDPSKSPAEPAASPASGQASAPTSRALTTSDAFGEARAPSAPLVTGPGALSAPDAGNRSNPSFGRLSEALRTTFATNTNPQASGSFAATRFGQSAPSSPLSASDRGVTIDPPAPVFGASADRSRIDSELDDILDEPLAPSAPAVAVADAKPSDSSGSGQWAVWRSPAGKPGEAEALKGTAGAALEPLPPSSPAMPSLGRPTGGFYPGSANFSQPSALPPSTPPSFGGTGRFEPTLPGGGDTESGRLGSLVPQRDDVTAPLPAARPRSPRFEPNLGSEPSRSMPPETRAEPGRAAPKPAAVVIAAMTPSASAGSAPSAPISANSHYSGPSSPVSTSTAGAGAPTAGMNVPLPPRTTLFSRPFSGLKSEPAAPAPPSAAAPPTVSSSAVPPPDRTRAMFSPSVTSSDAPSPRAPTLPLAAAQAAASTHALDALAAGFAAANAQPAAAVPPAAAAVTPVVSPRAPPPGVMPSVAPSAPPAEAAQHAAASGASGQPKTLEDMVADMVKPMLQKWLTDNMPRIIEKALRSEAGQPGGGGPKPPGT